MNKTEIKYKGAWTPQYLAERLLLNKSLSIQDAQKILESWALDLLEVNNPQSQSPDKEQPRELKEMLEKELPIVSKKRFINNNIQYEFNSDYQHYLQIMEDMRAEATKFFLSGKGAQGRETKWISVKELLPVNYKKVIVYTNMGNQYMSGCDASGELDDYSVIHTDEGEKITHWTPLLEPPTT